jgi:hypothetical protein
MMMVVVVVMLMMIMCMFESQGVDDAGCDSIR